MDKTFDLLKIKAEEFNISLSQEQLDQFNLYWRFLDEYNRHTNLVSTSDIETIVKKHFLDSLSIGLAKDYIRQDSSLKLIDIGIGGGFPGIPILIAYPAWKLCAVDSVGKKTKFIELLTEHLGIKNRVEIITGRAEELAQQENKREQFDIVVARAVSQLNILSEYCLPFVKPESLFIAYKAKEANAEIDLAKNALFRLGGKVEKKLPYTLPDTEDLQRNLILIRKIKQTPLQYPRKSGIPKKNPL